MKILDSIYNLFCRFNMDMNNDNESVGFNKISIYNICSYDDCNDACMLAKSIEESNEKYDKGYVYSLYQKASIKHIPYAERRLGALTIDGIGTDRDFVKGLGYYLLAAVDGDSYSENMFLGLQECSNISLTLSKGDISDALSGNTSSIIKLGAAFIAYGANYYRVIDLCADGANKGVLQCVFSVLDALYDIDNLEFQKNPLHREQFQQDNQWKSIASKYIENENIFREVLIVNSKERYNKIFQILKFLFLNYYDNGKFMQYAKEFYCKIVSETNSFNRDTCVNQDITDISNSAKFDEWLYTKVSQRIIVQRGTELFQGGNVITMNSFEDKIYANVIGSTGKIYNVQFCTDNHNIHNPSCNCQAFKKYDGVCKHVVAALIAGRNKIMKEVHYKNTLIPEYSASVGGKLIKHEKNVFIYRYTALELNSYIKKINNDDNINCVFCFGEEYYGNYSRIMYIEKNNNYEISIFYPRNENAQNVIIHLQKVIDNAVDVRESKYVCDFVRGL